MFPHFEDARHAQSAVHPVLGELAQSCHIVRQYHALFTRGPGEQVRIVDAREGRVAEANGAQVAGDSEPALVRRLNRGAQFRPAQRDVCLE